MALRGALGADRDDVAFVRQVHVDPRGALAAPRADYAWPVDTTVVAIVAPLVLLQLGLVVLALRDLIRPERRVRGPSKLLWGVIIVVGELLGPIVYFLFGRQEEEG